MPRSGSGDGPNLAGRVGVGQEVSEISRVFVAPDQAVFQSHGSGPLTLIRSDPREVSRSVRSPGIINMNGSIDVFILCAR